MIEDVTANVAADPMIRCRSGFEIWYNLCRISSLDRCSSFVVLIIDDARSSCLRSSVERCLHEKDDDVEMRGVKIR